MDEYPADSRMGELANTVQSCMKIDCDNFLPWDPKFHLGRTGYVDGIPPVALGNTSIRWFIDQFQRPGIAFNIFAMVLMKGQPPSLNSIMMWLPTNTTLG